MALTADTRLGPYEITALLGEGGDRARCIERGIPA
jgi:hypothetical protein